MKRYKLHCHHAKDALQQAMMQLMEKQDFDHITVNGICMDAAVSRTTFYQNYQDKFDLLVDCIASLVEPSPDQLERDDLEGYFDMCLTAGQQNINVLRRLYHYDGTREIQQKMDARFAGIFIRYYQLRQQHGAQYVLPVNLLSECVCAGVNSMINHWHCASCDLTKEEMVGIIARYIRQTSAAFLAGPEHAPAQVLP